MMMADPPGSGDSGRKSTHKEEAPVQADTATPSPPHPQAYTFGGDPYTFAGVPFIFGEPSVSSTAEEEFGPPPAGTQYLTGLDGAYLSGGDGSYLLGKMSEADARKMVADALLGVRTAFDEFRRQAPQMGHNNPPEPIETALSEAEMAATEVADQLGTETPDKSVLERAKAKFQALTVEAKILVGAGVIQVAQGIAKGIGASIWGLIEPHAQKMVEALSHWLATLI